MVGLSLEDFYQGYIRRILNGEEYLLTIHLSE
jgi:hypothetical protein